MSPSRQVVLVLAGALALQAQTIDTVRKQATELIQSGTPSQAVPLLESALVHSPTDLRARNLLGIALSSAGRRDEAIVQFRKVLQADPHFLPALKNLAMDELQLGRTSEARSHFSQALKAAPSDPAAHFGLAQVEFHDRHFDLAVQHFDRGGDLFSRDPIALLQYAEGCVETSRPARALEILGKLPGSAPAPAHFQAGMLLARLEQYAIAAAQFLKAKGPGTDTYAVGYNLALAQWKANDYAAAATTLENLAGSGLATTELYSLQARIYESSGKTKEAYDALRAAAHLDPRDETPYLELMALLATHENFQLGLEIADIGLRANPDAFRIRVDRGVLLALTGRMEDAEKEFARASSAAPSETLPSLARAIALMEMNRSAEAAQVLRRCEQRDPRNYLVPWHLAEALIRTGWDEAAEEAIAALRRSIAQNSAVARTHFLLGKILSQRGDSDAAIGELEAALRIDPDDVSATYLLAQTYRKKGDTARAGELFAKVSQSKADAANSQAGRSSLLRIIREGSR